MHRGITAILLKENKVLASTTTIIYQDGKWSWHYSPSLTAKGNV